MKEADLEPMSRNLKEGYHYVVNHGEGLTIVDFGGHVSLAEKEGACMVGRGGLARGKRSSVDEVEGRSCSVSIAPRKKMLAMLKEETVDMAGGFTGDMAGGDWRMKSQQGIILCCFETGDMAGGFMGAVGRRDDAGDCLAVDDWSSIVRSPTEQQREEVAPLLWKNREVSRSIDWEGDALGITGSMILSLLRGWVAAVDRGQLARPGMNTTNDERTRIFRSSKEKQRSWLCKRGVDWRLRLHTRPDAVGTCCRLTARRKLASSSGTPQEVEDATGRRQNSREGWGSNDAREINIDLVLVLVQHDDSRFRRGRGALNVFYDRGGCNNRTKETAVGTSEAMAPAIS
ncbi:hypothetical protein B296_00038361 [Ensete ventricosum]|uniref:Uncharacterized protein n=1 Tax=Ensete ventricosum TaxID=4639 RepID=A0A426ZCX0_ENSVE|nr:hypothetical protein B296_00038361 [Ensete ventricosum]